MTKTRSVSCGHCAKVLIVAADALSDTCPGCGKDLNLGPQYALDYGLLNLDDPALQGELAKLIASSASILIFGPPGAGKTSLLRYLTSQLDPRLRATVGARRAAGQAWGANARFVSPASGSSAVDTMRAALATRPDILVWDDLRGAEARVLIQATSQTRLRAFTTIDATHPFRAFKGLLNYASLPGNPPDQLSPAEIEAGVCRQARYLIEVQRFPSGERTVCGAYEMLSASTFKQVFHAHCP